MKKIIIISLILVFAVMLIADQREDLQFAVGLYRDKNYELAKVELKKFLTNYPQSKVEADIKFLLGNIYLAEEDHKNAEKYFSELYAVSPHPAILAEVALGLGQSRYFLNQYKQAKTVFQKFVSDYSDNQLAWKAYYYLGKINFIQNDFDSALSNLEKALTLDHRALILSAILELKIAQNKLTDIDEVANEIIQKPDSENKFRAMLLYQNYNLLHGRTDKIFSVGLDMIPSTSQYFGKYNLILGTAFYEVRRFDEALDRLKKLDNEKAQYYSALCYYELHNEKKAKNILNELVNSTNDQISSNSTFYLAKIDDNIEMLQKFIEDNPNHNFTPVAYYQLGYDRFRKNDFSNSLSFFTKARNSGNTIGDEAYNFIKEKTFYLIAESSFLTNKKEDALKAYELYISVFPHGDFTDEANFKLGLLNFQNGNHEISEAYFNKVRDQYTNSEKVGMSNYYIGEIYFKKGDYSKALGYYQDALGGVCDVGFTWERIGHIHYFNKNYKSAKKSLENIPSDTKYLFDRFLLKGNIEFAERNYSKALEAYSFAADHTGNSVQEEAVLSRKAWTLYQLKRFDEASRLYSRLSGTTTSPEKYIIKAATSAFSAENYLSAIEYFKQYTQNFPSAPDYYSAILGTADSYYNLGDFNNAVNHYTILIQPGIDDKILNNSINGLRWASEQSETIDFTEKVDELLRNCSDKKIRIELLDRKIYYLYKKENWQEAINTSKELEILDPEHKNILEIKLMKALCYENLGDYQNSVATYEELYSKKHDPGVLRHWSKLLVKMNDYTGAIDKLRKASMLSRNEDIWLELLEIELEQNNEFFENDFNKFMEFATGEEREIAQLLEVEWKMNLDQIEELNSRIKDLSKSKYKSVKARSQFLKGLLLSKNGDDETAIPELLRMRYLYPEFEKIRNRAEALACISYMNVNNYDEAKKLFDVIKNDISAEMKEKLENLLQGEDK
ncbi:MAG: tetratricopeptide repeat protein [Candidatus Cloacimonetes bacterium]|nr:tetratricopeptide repeat protein [Candidatus Cloacimonadota bacterium]